MNQEHEPSILTESVGVLELSCRSANCLANTNIQTIGELVRTTASTLLKTKNFGRKSLKEIEDKLATGGLQLAQNVATATSVRNRDAFRFAVNYIRLLFDENDTGSRVAYFELLSSVDEKKMRAIFNSRARWSSNYGTFLEQLAKVTNSEDE